MKYLMMIKYKDAEGPIAFKPFYGKNLRSLKGFVSSWAARNNIQILEKDWAKL